MSDLYHDYLTKKRIEAHNALIRQMKNHYPNNEGFKTLTEKTVINAVGNYPLNAWQHSYTIGKLYFSLGEFTSRTIGYVKECAAINHLSIATFEDTLKDLYNNARGIELAKQCANVEEFESRLFELEFTSNEDGTGIVPVSRLGFNPTSRNRDIEFKIEKAA